MSHPRFAVVVPTVGRDSLAGVGERVDGSPRPVLLVVVDDRPDPGATPVLDVRKVPVELSDRCVVVRTAGRGPAAARNAGWRAVPADVDWIAFLDDDVLPPRDWSRHLLDDLSAVHQKRRVAASQAQIDVPLPAGRRPTDRERATAGLATARWITADMAYRRAVLVETGGFDESFPNAYREDSDLALRVQDAGYRLVVGDRVTSHPVHRGRWDASVRAQRGNADDVVMRRRYGRRWRDRAGDDGGRNALHVLSVTAAAVAVTALITRRRHLALGAAGAWAALTARFAVDRIAPGPRTPAETAVMIATSVLIPFAALRGWATGVRRPVAPQLSSDPIRLQAVLFDRDGTLVQDVPYNGDPGAVVPVTGAQRALGAVRSAGLVTGVVTNQSGIASGHLSWKEVDAVNHRVSELLGSFDAWVVCPHAADDNCDCRKPKPRNVQRICGELQVDVTASAMVGDIGSDVEAARSAGARAVLVPTAATLDVELAAAPVVCSDLCTAMTVLLGRSVA